MCASVRAIAKEWTSGAVGNSPQPKPLGGYATMLKALSDAIDRKHVQMKLQTILRTVRWEKGAVHLELDSLNGPFKISARSAIVTLPISILQLPADDPGSVRFDPPLKEKAAPLGKLALGPAIKAVLRFRIRFWE